MKELLLKRATVFEQARAIVLKAETEARSLTSDEQVEYDKRMADVKALGDTIQRSRENAETAAQLGQSLGPAAGGADNRRAPGSDLADSAMTSFIRGGVNSLSVEQRGVFGSAPAAGTLDHVVYPGGLSFV